jgi:Fe-S oxidoreductase
MRHAAGQTPIRHRLTTQMMARTHMIGSIATAITPLANSMIRARAGSMVRRMVATVTGVSAVRLLPSFAVRPFSVWFARRTPNLGRSRQGSVTVYPTCVVEYQATGIGADLVEVYERNGLECSLSDAGCCGAPWLHAGHLERFRKVAERNVETLAAEVRSGGDIVVAQSTCGRMLTQAYVDHVGSPDARFVADHTYDAAEYLMRVHTAAGTELDTDFQGEVPTRITYHVAGHVRADHVGFPGRDLMALTGAAVSLVEQGSATDGMWGFRSEHDELAISIAQRLAAAIEQAGGLDAGTIVAGDCHLANIAIAEQTGITPVHPISLIARAYGMPPA